MRFSVHRGARHRLSSLTFTPSHQRLLVSLFGALCLLLLPEMAMAAGTGTDLLAPAKADVTATMTGGTLKYIIYGGAAVMAAIVGVFQKNWIAGVTTFIVAMIFWNVATSILGTI
ncbi:hypothetical protein ACPV5U_27665 [Vibrio mediterranei]